MTLRVDNKNIDIRMETGEGTAAVVLIGSMITFIIACASWNIGYDTCLKTHGWKTETVHRTTVTEGGAE